MKRKNKKKFLSTVLGILGANIFGTFLAGKGTIAVGEGTIIVGWEF